MKKHLLMLIAVAIVSISSSVVTSRIICTPAVPKQVFVKYYSNDQEAISDIKNLSKQGWIVKSFVVAGQYAGYTYLIMEKY
jgi:hypothetical protein